MPLFERKKGKVDATRHWVGDMRFPLELDLTRKSLSGVRIGGTVDGLMRLGPAEDREAAEDEIYRYYSRGLEVTADDGFVSGFRLLWDPMEGFQPYSGTTILRGEPITLGQGTSESELKTLLGEPYWRDEDEAEILLFYELGEVEWQIELNKEGRLGQWSIVSPPLMADDEQRLAYGVTKPWPPASPDRIRPRTAGRLFGPRK